MKVVNESKNWVRVIILYCQLPTTATGTAHIANGDFVVVEEIVVDAPEPVGQAVKRLCTDVLLLVMCF